MRATCEQDLVTLPCYGSRIDHFSSACMPETVDLVPFVVLQCRALSIWDAICICCWQIFQHLCAVGHFLLYEHVVMECIQVPETCYAALLIVLDCALLIDLGSLALSRLCS